MAGGWVSRVAGLLGLGSPPPRPYHPPWVRAPHDYAGIDPQAVRCVAQILAIGEIPCDVWLRLSDEDRGWKRLRRDDWGRGMHDKVDLAARAVRYFLMQGWHWWGDGLELLPEIQGETALEIWARATGSRSASYTP